MSLDSAIKFAKNVGADKVPFRFQFPVDIKEDFEELCQKHNVSMTDMILGLIKSAIDEDRGLTNVSVVNIINKIEKLEEQYANLLKIHKMYILQAKVVSESSVTLFAFTLFEQ